MEIRDHTELNVYTALLAYNFQVVRCLCCMCVDCEGPYTTNTEVRASYGTCKHRRHLHVYDIYPTRCLVQCVYATNSQEVLSSSLQ